MSPQLLQASVRQLAHRAGGDGPVFGPALCGRKPVQSALEAQLQEGLQRRGQQNISGRSNFLFLLCLNTREPLPEPGERMEVWVSQGHPHYSSGTEVLVKVDHWNAPTCYLSSCTTEGTLLICATETICRHFKCNSNQLLWKQTENFYFNFHVFDWQAWAVASGKINDFPNDKARWKTNFRSALYNLSERFKMVQDNSKNSDDPHKIYQIINTGCKSIPICTFLVQQCTV